MAINPQTQYPGRISPGTPDYPYGSARNVTTPGDGSGTPWEAALVNDLFGFQQAILSRAGAVPTGSPEKVGASQYLDGLLSLAAVQVPTITDMVALDSSAISEGAVITVSEARRGGVFEVVVGTITGDGGTAFVFDDDSNKYARRVFSGPYMLAWYGEVGDGVADDTELLNRALTNAGVNAEVCGSPGDVYLISNSVTTLAGQTLRGCGSTIKKVGQAVTTTTSAISSGSTDTVTLSDASGITEGSRVAFAQQGVARGSLVFGVTLSSSRTVTNVAGNTITLDAPVNISVGIGGTCFTAFSSVVLADNATVKEFMFAGNKANWTYSRWEVVHEVATVAATGNHSVIGNFFSDSPGEAVIPQGPGLLIEGNYFKGLNGNAVHLSAVSAAVISGNIADNGNIDPDMGHQDGFVSFSNDNSHVLVTNNVASNFISGAGAINNTDADITVSDNDFSDMYCFGIEGGAGASRVTVTSNRINNVPTDTSKKPGIPFYGGLVFVAVSGSDYIVEGNIVSNVDAAHKSLAISGQGGSNLKINNNILSGDITVGDVDDYNLSGNTVAGNVVVGATSGATISGNTVNADSVALSLNTSSNYTDVTISGNAINGGVNGVSFTTSATSYERVNVKGNIFRGQSNRNVTFDAYGGTIDGFNIDENSFILDASSPASFNCIVCANNGVTIARNKLINTDVASSRIGINVAGAATADKMLIVGNEVRGAWSHTIIPATNAGVYCVNNLLETKDVSNQTGNNITGSVVF